MNLLSLMFYLFEVHDRLNNNKNLIKNRNIFTYFTHFQHMYMNHDHFLAMIELEIMM